MKKILLPLALTACLIPAASFAEDNSFYAEGDLGYLTVQKLNRDFFERSSSNIKGKVGPAFALRGGYLYSLTDNFSIATEAGYFNLNKLKLNLPGSATFKQEGVDTLLVGKYNFSNGLFIFAKGGVAFVSQDLRRENYSTRLFSKWHHHVMPETAAGLGYQFSDHFALTGTMSHLFDTNYQKTDSTAAMLGLRINF